MKVKVLATLLMLSAEFALPCAAAGQIRPGPSVVAGARRLPDVNFMRRVKRGCDRYVSTAGDDANSGRSARAAWRTVGMALRTLRAGQVGCVLSGTYEEGHNEAAHDGTPSAPIVLRRAPNSRTMPVVRPKGPVAVLHIDRDYWVLDGLDVDVSFQKVTGVRFMENADHGVLRNSRVHNSTSGASVYIAGRDILVEGCEIFNNFQANEQDSHGVAIVQAAARVMVRRSRIWDNGGDGIQCEDYATAAANPEDITLEDNLIYTTPANMGRTENAIDIKSCRYITVRGSAPVGPAGRGAARNKFYGFTLKPTARGEAVVIHYNARYVLIENTHIRDACRGVSIGRGEDRSTLVEHVVVRGNLIEDLRQGQNCDGDAILVSRAHHLDVHDNLLRNIPRAAFRAGVNNSTGVPDADIDFWGNTVGAARWLNLGTGAAQLEGFASDRNLFMGDDEGAPRFYLDGKFVTMREWRRMAGTASVLSADPRSRVRRSAPRL